MDSVELQVGSCTTAQETAEGRSSSNEIENKAKEEEIISNSDRNRIRNRKSSYLPRFGCLKIEEDNKGGTFDMQVVEGMEEQHANPTHLVVMVNGLVGSAQNWKYAAKQLLKQYPSDLIVHCSKSNPSMLTFDGVDVMGERLAEEVISVIERHPSVQKISFVGHSLGGLVARYAIGRLYEQDIPKEVAQDNGGCNSDESGDKCVEEKFKPRIAGLEPLNFITYATPHLGSRWHKQVPAFCGLHTLENVAPRISWFLGRTGKHLFLADTDNGKHPLLLQMVSDSEDLKFLSALQSFKRRVAYANARFDHLVGWSTSSLRHHSELPDRKHLSRDERYPHIVNVETSETAGPQQELDSETKVDGCHTIDMEDHFTEEMMRALTKMTWERVDVTFRRSISKFLAHSTIQVKTYWINSDGADVVQHMIDNFLV